MYWRQTCKSQRPTIPGVRAPQPDKRRVLFLCRLIFRFVDRFFLDVRGFGGDDTVHVLPNLSTLQRKMCAQFCMVGSAGSPLPLLQAAADENSSNLQNYEWTQII